MTATPAGDPRDLAACRDDGIIAQSFGRFVEGRLPPLLPALAGATVTIVLAAVGVARLSGIMVAVPVAAMGLAGLGSAHPHDGRLDWLVPPLLQLGEYAFLVAVALAGRVPMPLLFAVVAVVALHHYDVAYRMRPGAPAPRRWLAAAGLGWEGRMLVAALGAISGLTTLAYAVLAGYLWVLFGGESLTGWIGAAGRGHPARPGPRSTGAVGRVEDGGGG